MTLTERIHERRDAEGTANIFPIVERRGGETARQPRWITWTRENEKRGKDLTDREAL